MSLLGNPPWDFDVDLRIDLVSTRVGDSPCGRNPVVLHVRNGAVDVGELRAFAQVRELPAGRLVEQAMQSLVTLDGISTNEFLIGLYTLSTQSHRELAARLFEQAPVRTSLYVLPSCLYACGQSRWLHQPQVLLASELS